MGSRRVGHDWLLRRKGLDPRFISLKIHHVTLRGDLHEAHVSGSTQCPVGLTHYPDTSYPDTRETYTARQGTQLRVSSVFNSCFSPWASSLLFMKRDN